MHIDVEGYEKKLYIADTLAMNLERVKHSVLKGGWDYVCVVSGLPGVGKSTFAQALAKFLDPTFNVDRICFTGREFRDKTVQGSIGQAYVLDESFADMNTSLSKDPDFIATVNHMQLIRQKNLFIILVLPDFFSLSKNIAIFRASHLFIPYSVDYTHGDVAVFDRETKRELYIKGKQFLNYQAVQPNFRTDFQMGWFVDEEIYKQRKEQHLIEQSKVKEKGAKASNQRNLLCYLLHKETKMTLKQIATAVYSTEDAVKQWHSEGVTRFKELKGD